METGLSSRLGCDPEASGCPSREAGFIIGGMGWEAQTLAAWASLLRGRVSWRSRSATEERTALERPGCLATFALSGHARGDVLSDLMDIGCEIVHGFKLDAFAALDGIGRFLGGGA